MSSLILSESAKPRAGHPLKEGLRLEL